MKLAAQSSLIEPANFRLPSMSGTQIQAIASPQKGMMVYDADIKTLRFFDGITWVSSNAQTSNFESQNLALFRGNTSNHDLTYAAKTDNQGNVFVYNAYKGTVTYGSYTFTNSDVNYYKFCVVKFDTDGNVLWAMDLNGISSPENMAIDNEGNLILSIDTFLKKFDSMGNLVFSVGLISPIIYELEAAPNGNIYAVIRTDNPFTQDGVLIGCENLPELSGGKRGIVCFNASGVVQWERGICNSSNFSINNIFTDEQNAVYFTGAYNYDSVDLSEGTDSNGILPATTNGKNFLGKYNQNGVFQWVKVISNNNASTANTIRQLIPTKFSNNNLFLSVGYSSNDLYYDSSLILSTNPCLQPNTENSEASFNAIECRINTATGQLQSTQQDIGGDIAVSSNNNFYHINAYSCPLSDVICSVSYPNKIITKRNSLGEVAWATKTNAKLQSVVKGINKTVWVAGWFSSGSLTFGRAALTTNQPFSMFLLRIKE